MINVVSYCMTFIICTINKFETINHFYKHVLLVSSAKLREPKNILLSLFPILQ